MANGTAIITKSTGISVAIVISLISMAVYGSVWCARLEMRVDANAELKADVKQIKADVAEIKMQMRVHNVESGK